MYAEERHQTIEIVSGGEFQRLSERPIERSEIQMKIKMFRTAQNQPFKDYYHNLLCKTSLLAVLLLISLNLEIGLCQETSRLNSANATEVTDKTVQPKSDDKDDAGELILSGDEFVDSREVPLILFDGTASENSTSARSSNSTRQAHVINSITTSSNSSHSPSIALPESFKEKPNRTSTTASSNSTKLDEQANKENEEDEESEDETENPSNRMGDNSAPNQVFEPPQSIAQYMDYIEKLFHDLRHQIAQLFEPHLPQLIRTSQMVELSSACSYDMLRMALALRQFEPWALRMIDSSGKVPEGIFEGSFTALGSFDECLGIVFQSSGQDSGQEQTSAPPTQGQYCLVTVSPFMPPKPPADRVDRLFQEEANRRNYTRDDQFSRLSPMFYYMKFRIGVCIPSSCDQDDMSSISSALSSSLRLNITIPDCRIKQAERRFTEAQLVGGLIFGLVVALVLLATLADCFKLKWKQLENQDIEFLQQSIKQNDQRHEDRSAMVKIGLTDHFRQSPDSIDAHAHGGRARFIERLAKHWSWMSFSLIANFRLYFSSPSTTTATTTATTGNAEEHNQRGRQQAETTAGATCQISADVLTDHQEEARHQMVACLNGIRVLSLCWIIVANSYLTLDPRATKRLTKTREAPRDFLFQLVIQASLAIETFFFLSGLLMSLSFARHLKPSSPFGRKISSNRAPGNSKFAIKLLKWFQFYVHRYIRITPPTMLVIAISMYAYHFGDGPLWFEATARVHQSCSQNWWRHLLHVANFIDTRQMCFIHYWYIAADMQLFVLGPLIMSLLYKCRRLGYLLISSLGMVSMALVFYITYTRQLPPTLLFYSTDPESRREFGNTIMTKPFTHALPYLVGMLVGWLCLIKHRDDKSGCSNTISGHLNGDGRKLGASSSNNLFSATGLFGSLAVTVALVELFLPYKWNNSHLPTPLLASIYAALFRLGWSLVLAYVVVSCGHLASRQCESAGQTQEHNAHNTKRLQCYCSSGGNYLNKLLGLPIFKHLSKLSFVAYLVHLPLMSAFIGQTRGLFAFSHTLVLHFAVSYLVISFALALILVHFIEFPFITFERLLFDSLFKYLESRTAQIEQQGKQQQQQQQPKANTLAAVMAHEKYLFYEDPRSRSAIRPRMGCPHRDSLSSGRHELALTFEQQTSDKMDHRQANSVPESAQINGALNRRPDLHQQQQHFMSERL